MGMTCSPLTTAASAALSFGTNNPILSSALARSAIGRTPLTVRTPPVGNLPPPDYSTEILDFTAFQSPEALPSRTQNHWGISEPKAGRSRAITAKTGRNVGHWSDRHGRREMGEEPEPADRRAPEGNRPIHRIRCGSNYSDRRALTDSNNA